MLRIDNLAICNAFPIRAYGALPVRPRRGRAHVADARCLAFDRAAMMAAAMLTLYSVAPVEVLTRLLSATVIGLALEPPNTMPNRKSFQIWVNCQMKQTMKIGSDSGRMMRR